MAFAPRTVLGNSQPMKQRHLVFAAVGVGVLVALAIAAFAYDASRKDTIAKGVTAGGIDIGGMSKSEATKALEEKLSTPLSQPLVVRYGHRKFHLSAARAHLTTDVDGMVQEAIDESRGGNFLGRSIRGLTGGSVNVSVPPRVDYSRSAVRRLVLRVKATVDRKPADASVQPAGAGLNAVPAKLGIAVRGRQLTKEVRAALVRPDGTREVVAQSKITKPK